MSTHLQRSEHILPPRGILIFQSDHLHASDSQQPLIFCEVSISFCLKFEFTYFTHSTVFFRDIDAHVLFTLTFLIALNTAPVIEWERDNEKMTK